MGLEFIAFSHLQFSQIRGRQPYSIVRKIPYLIRWYILDYKCGHDGKFLSLEL